MLFNRFGKNTELSRRRELANALRVLAMDAVQRANSGHPGMPMGMADIAEVLWNSYLKHNPSSPMWPDRDRFVVSNGHGSMLLYALLHLTGYEISLEDLRSFRQMDSRTPGHPEHGLTPGVETTTGPLGQGLANAVGMAVAERALAARYNRDQFKIVDHFTYVFAGDGCLMEGISHEACSLAGSLKLGRLIVFYDDNGVSIDGDVSKWFGDDTVKRFEAYGWQVIPAVNGHDARRITRAIDAARQDLSRPTLICCKTVIGFGAPNMQGSAATHGAPLGEEEIAAARAELNWKHKPFVIPRELRQAWDARELGEQREAIWYQMLIDYRAAHQQLAEELERRWQGDAPEGFDEEVEAFIARCQRQPNSGMATRKASQACLEAYGPLMPELIGGSADLTGSNNTRWQGCVTLDSTVPDGNYIYYGVREFAMSAIANGIALHGGFIPYCGTFLVFHDYARNAVRLAALMGLRCIFVYTHDSIGLGEDGPTHQPLEQLTTLRATPRLELWRPCDLSETAVAWREALRHSGPTALALSRQSLPLMERTEEQLKSITRGGYVIRACQERPELVILATGSELSLAVETAERLSEQKLRVSVVSMPCAERFLIQEQAYRDLVLPAGVPRLAIEASHADYWRKFVGLEGAVLGLDSFGASAPGPDLMRARGFTSAHACELALELLAAT